MAHRKREIDLIGRIAWIAGIALLASLIFPAVRRMLAGLGSLMVGGLFLVAASLLAFGIYRLATRTRRLQGDNGNPFAPSDDDPEPAWKEDDEPATPLELLGPTLRRRYPWRH